LRIDNGRPRRILAVEGQDIEGEQLHFLVVLARVQRVEIGDAVSTPSTTASPSTTNCLNRFFSALIRNKIANRRL
jgi:hypothetical protein